MIARFRARLLPQSIRWRLTLWYAAALSAGLGVFAVASLAVLDVELEHRNDQFLRDARQAFLVELAVELGELPTTESAVRMALDEIRFEDTRFFVQTTDVPSVLATRADSRTDSVQAPIWQMDSLVLQRLRSTAAGGDGTPSADVAASTLPNAYDGARMITGQAMVRDRWFTVAAVRDLAGIAVTMRDVRRAYLLVIPVILLLSVVVGYLLARRALEPVATMSRHAQTMDVTTLHDRLPVQNPQDELGGLATVMNELLARLERGFAQQRQFVADASHELRTPVAILQAEADVALARAARSEEEYRQAIGVMSSASQRLSRIVDDLFLLARVDSGRRPVDQQPLYLDEVLADTVRSMHAVAARRDVHLVLQRGIPPEDGAPFTGDPELLGRLLLNLIDNAVKYSPAGGTVRARLDQDGTQYRITVSDEGPGIPADARPFIFDRFYRVDRARSRDNAADVTSTASGAGLGLAIAQWIAQAHGGAVALTASAPPGAHFEVRLPRPPSDALGSNDSP